jgi:DNA-binding transcriptional LysR family regulator
MLRENITDLLSFQVVAREQSFTRAAAQLRVSQSALSHAIRGLEERLGIRLLNRTTRRVSLTDAGEQLLRTLEPSLDDIEQGLYALSDMRDKPAGLIRISAGEHSANTVIWPCLARFLPNYPDIQVEVNIENSLTDIIAERYDAGVRLGEQIAQDMIAVRISKDLRISVVGSPAYFDVYGIPQTPVDLHKHKCINLRLMTMGGLYSWEFKKDDRELKIAVNGQLTFNTTPQMMRAAEANFGLAYVPEDMVNEQIADGRLIRVLEDWCPNFPGYYLYYPSRRQHNTAFALLLEALRYSDQ